MLHHHTVLPQDPEHGQPLMVLLHGRGSDEQRMMVWADFFPCCMLVFVRALFDAQRWGYGPGYAWYRHVGGTIPDPDHFEQSQQALHSLLKHLPETLPVRPGPVILGGFSQGGTMSMGYALRHPGEVRACLNLSGFLATHPSVKVSPTTVDSTQFYWPHGLQDSAIPHSIAKQGRATLRAAGAKLIAPDYPIGHKMIKDEIEDIRALIQNLQPVIC